MRHLKQLRRVTWVAHTPGGKGEAHRLYTFDQVQLTASHCPPPTLRGHDQANRKADTQSPGTTTWLFASNLALRFENDFRTAAIELDGASDVDRLTPIGVDVWKCARIT